MITNKYKNEIDYRKMPREYLNSRITQKCVMVKCQLFQLFKTMSNSMLWTKKR